MNRDEQSLMRGVLTDIAATDLDRHADCWRAPAMISVERKVEDVMKVRCPLLDTGRTYAASLVEAPSFINESLTRTVLEVDSGGANLQIEPPGGLGTEVVEATPDEWAGLRAAGYDLSQAAVSPAPADAAAHNDRGCELLTAGRLEEALQEFTCAIDLDPNDATFYYNRGYVYSMHIKRMGWARVESAEGRQLALIGSPQLLAILDQAIADYTSAIERDSQKTSALGMRAEMYQMKGLRELAIADYQRAVELGDEVAKRLLKERFGIG